MQIMDKENTSLYSIASIWEIAIKLKLGKIGVSRRLDSSFQEILEANGLDSLPITFSHVCRVARLPLHHRDPFDRLLAAQVIEERMAVVRSLSDEPGHLRSNRTSKSDRLLAEISHSTLTMSGASGREGRNAQRMGKLHMPNHLRRCRGGSRDLNRGL